MSADKIAEKLNELNVPTKHNKVWFGSQVFQILKNPRYVGKTFERFNLSKLIS